MHQKVSKIDQIDQNLFKTDLKCIQNVKKLYINNKYTYVAKLKNNQLTSEIFT